MPIVRDLLRSERYKALRTILKDQRDALDVGQEHVGEAIGRPQTFVSDVETAVRRVDVIEFLRLAKTLELDPLEVLSRVLEVEDTIPPPVVPARHLKNR